MASSFLPQLLAVLLLLPAAPGADRFAIAKLRERVTQDRAALETVATEARTLEQQCARFLAHEGRNLPRPKQRQAQRVKREVAEWRARRFCADQRHPQQPGPDHCNAVAIAKRLETDAAQRRYGPCDRLLNTETIAPEQLELRRDCEDLVRYARGLGRAVEADQGKLRRWQGELRALQRAARPRPPQPQPQPR